LGPAVSAVAGDVADGAHREALVAEARRLGPVRALVNNASTLGPGPLPQLATVGPGELAAVLDVDVVAPLALAQLVLPDLRANRGVVVNVTSDAAVEAYEGWGVYGSAKAALEQWSAVLAVEEPDVRVYAVDPGDMRTRMHQDAFPGEDISDRPEPGASVPGLVALLDGTRPSGRYRAREVEVAVPATPAVNAGAGS
ncbi:MAG TPA: SDR family NAD(P)-dependent oxidoreductase, partial [Acidimicrobiales bacterium]